MAGKIVVDTIQSDSSYASRINVTSNVAFTSPVNFTGGMQVGGQDATFGGMRNRIINGAMMIDQRYSGSGNTLVNTTETFVVDRFVAYKDAGVITSGQSSVAPTGFRNSLSWSVGTGATATSGQYFFIKQHIEGFNTADLGFGTASASTVTLSFWVRASITGTYSGSLNNGAADRSYGFTYTINSANTWEYKSITVPGDTSGTWVGATNGTGLRVYWDMGCHSSVRNSSAGVWGGGVTVGVAGTTSLSATTGATFYITGVQLEKGSAATAFEHRQYGQELTLCQRYYEVIYFDGSGYYAVSTARSATSDQWFIVWFKTQKRVAATGTLLTGSWMSATPSTTGGISSGYHQYTGSTYYRQGNAGDPAIAFSAEF